MMLDANSREALDEFAARVRQEFPGAQIWGYGSRVRGGNREDSDLDVCVVLEHLDEESDERVMDAAWQVGFERGLVVSTVTYSRAEFEQGPCSVSGHVQAVLQEGLAV
jgi:predicted nucleotidyltransferase